MTQKTCVCEKNIDNDNALVITITTCSGKHFVKTNSSYTKGKCDNEKEQKPGKSGYTSVSSNDKTKIIKKEENQIKSRKVDQSTGNEEDLKQTGRGESDIEKSDSLSTSKDFSLQHEGYMSDVSEEDFKYDIVRSISESELPILPYYSVDSDKEKNVKVSLNVEDDQTKENPEISILEKLRVGNIPSEIHPRLPILTSRDQNYDKPTSGILEQDRVESSDLEIYPKLPILSPRYQGSGCAMEFLVLEKHEHNCRNRKKENSKRNPVEDKIGSYEAVRRVTFQTCQVENVKTKLKSGEPPLENNVVYAFMAGFPLKPSKSDLPIGSLQHLFNKQELLNCFNRNIEPLVLDSDKVDKIHHDICVDHNKSFNIGQQDSDCVRIDAFFAGKRVEQSVQTEDSAKETRKKWYHFLFPCLFS